MGRRNSPKGGQSPDWKEQARYAADDALDAPSDGASGHHEVVSDAPDVVIVRRGAESGFPRRPPRLEVRLVVSVESESNFYAGFTENLSESGVFVATHAPLGIGSAVDLWIYLPHKEPICARGTVRWQRRGSGAGDTAVGMGIRFDRVSAQDTVRIHEFAQARAPMFFDDESADGSKRATLKP